VKTTLAVLLPAVLVTGCVTHATVEQPPQGVQAQRIEASPGVTSAQRYSALVTPDAQTPLAFRIPGYVVSLKQVRGPDGRLREIAEGDRVRRGELLAQIRNAEYQDKVRQASSVADAAQAAAVKAQLDYERATRLYEAQSLTKPDFDTAQAQYDATRAQVRAAVAQTSEAQTALTDTTLLAPFDGEIVKKTVELGSFVGPGTPTFVIASTELAKIIVGVPDTMVRSLRVGQPTDVAVDAFPNRPFRASISRIASAADPTSRHFEVEVAIRNHDHLLKTGMIGSLQFVVEGREAPQPSISVPLGAIVPGPGGKYGVFLVAGSSAGDIAQLRPVEIGSVNGNEISIASGLAAGDTVITMGATLLKDGQRVEVLQ
jgi:RND family efflux transporter MFP subunit